MSPLNVAIPLSLLSPPVVVVDRDNVEIRESCIVEIRADVIRDDDGNGVIHILADDIIVTFSDEHRELMGAPLDTPRDEMTGVGVRIDGRTNVTLINAHVHCFKVGVWATEANGLTIERCDAADGYAMRLRSTPQAEDSADWLWPHRNDDNEWMANYGAGIWVEDSSGVTIRECFARRRQNGIVLDRVTDAQVYDNDCSFLSGWGLAMWRTSRSLISRNAFDFCVRGYSHGVYNRGQDSAGILMFEQCSDNVFAENSATHGGDGLFAFAGRDALGEQWLDDERARLRAVEGRDQVDNLVVIPADAVEPRRRLGNNRNLFINNDFSFAPAHGLELTFSFDNQIVGNTFEGNAICGIWGGYSQDTLIAQNAFLRNGEMAYGLERGGVNIEHGRGNIIVDNAFRENRCGVHLWWDADDGLMNLPWAKANHVGALPADGSGGFPLASRPTDGARMLASDQNIVANNTFERDGTAIHARDCDRLLLAGNTMRDVEKPVDATTPPTESQDAAFAIWSRPAYPVRGETRPVGARAHLRGRDKIIMDEWGPYDWRSPRLRHRSESRLEHVYEVLGNDPLARVEASEGVAVEPREGNGFAVTCDLEGAVTRYSLVVHLTSGATLEHAGVFVDAAWNVSFFAYDRELADPRSEMEAWRQAADRAVGGVMHDLSLPFGGGGPSDLAAAPDAVRAASLPREHFGSVATTSIAFPAGRWTIDTLSDDGLRVWIDEDIVIDDWTWHPPKRQTATIDLAEPSVVAIRVEHFELDGYAVLEVSIRPEGD